MFVRSMPSSSGDNYLHFLKELGWRVTFIEGIEIS